MYHPLWPGLESASHVYFLKVYFSMESGNVVEEHVGPEITFLENKIYHRFSGSFQFLLFILSLLFFQSICLPYIIAPPLGLFLSLTLSTSK